MIPFSFVASWRRSICLVVLLVMSALSAARAADTASAKPSTRPATTNPARARRIQRLLAIRAATMAAYNYAEAHDHAIPSTEQLAKSMGVAAKDFQYRVVRSGSLDKHIKRVNGDWPILIAEKHGGENGEWAFGFADGHCSIGSAKSYQKWEDTDALQIIREASTRLTTAP
jgi:hypothetical protein